MVISKFNLPVSRTYMHRRDNKNVLWLQHGLHQFSAPLTYPSFSFLCTPLKMAFLGYHSLIFFFSIAKSMKLIHHPSGPEKISSLNSTRRSIMAPPSCLRWNSTNYNSTMQTIYSCRPGSDTIGSAQTRRYCPLVLGPLLLIPGPLVTSVPRRRLMNR